MKRVEETGAFPAHKTVRSTTHQIPARAIRMEPGTTTNFR
jgi:hypothetical protein